MKATLFTSAALFLLGVAGATASANILTDPGFESNPLAPSFNTVLNNFPVYQNQWGAESGSIVGVTGGISPASGNNMLQLNGPGTGTVSQAGQVVDITSSAALVDAGNAVIQAGAMLNSNAVLPIGGVYVSFFTRNTYGTIFGPAPTNVINVVPNTWQSVSVSAPIPPLTRWILVQVGFDANSISNSAGIVTAGFADDAFANVVAVPEPASIGLLGIGGLGLLARRRGA